MVAKLIYVQPGQSLIDLAIQEYKTVRGVYTLLAYNQEKLQSITQELEPGTQLEVRPLVTDWRGLFKSPARMQFFVHEWMENVCLQIEAGNYNHSWSVVVCRQQLPAAFTHGWSINQCVQASDSYSHSWNNTVCETAIRKFQRDVVRYSLRASAWRCLQHELDKYGLRADTWRCLQHELGWKYLRANTS